MNEKYIPLNEEIRSHLPTEDTAFHLIKKPQTLRSWACLENGPIHPIRIHGRLFWPTAEIKKLLNGEV